MLCLECGEAEARKKFCGPTCAYRAGKRAAEGHREFMREYHRRRNYRLGNGEYARMLSEQGGRCLICKAEPNGVLNVDHDHETGRVRGLLCRHCNSGLGFFRDSKELLVAAQKYLSQP